MKNIHILPTDKPSRLFIDVDDNKLKICIPLGGEHMMNQHIYITNDEEIKEGDWLFSSKTNNIFKADSIEYLESHNMIEDFDKSFYINSKYSKKIILTTDKSLDGVQAIDDEFLQWFAKNSSREYVQSSDSSIPQEESKQETTLEEAAKDYIENTMKFSFNSLETKTQANRMLKCIEFGAKWQAERMYSEKEVRLMLSESFKASQEGYDITSDSIIEQFKKK
jgi:hypothetical protein